MREELEVASKDIPESFKSRPSEWGRKLTACFNSPKMTPEKRRAAKRNLAMGTIVPISALFASHFYSIKEAQENKTVAPDFPFDLLATSLTMNAWTALVQCQNELMPSSGPPKTWMRQKFENYRRYFWMNLAGVGVYTGFIAIEDAARGEDIFTSQKMAAYGKEGMFGFGWDSATDMAHVLILDKFFVRYLPRGGTFVRDLLRKKIFRGSWVNAGSKRFLKLQLKDWANSPGLLMEFLVRQGYVSTRAFSYLQFRNALFPPQSNESSSETNETLGDQNFTREFSAGKY